MGPELQQRVIRALAGELRASETGAVISAMDETNPATFAANWESYPAEVRDLVGQLNVHTYGTSGRTAVRDIAKAQGAPLWMSEVGGDWDPDGQDFTDMASGLGLAQHITDDLRELEPTAWVFWQPVEDYNNMAPGGEFPEGGNWGSIQIPFDCTAGDTLETCPIRTNTKFDTARNFTHYIQPGDRLIATDEPSSTAAVTADGRGATVVHVNGTDEAREVTLDLSKFGRVAPGATVTPVVTDASGALAEQAPVPVTGGSATVTVPAESVTTFLIDGVAGVAPDAAAFQPGQEYQLTGVQSGRALAADDDGTVVIRDADPADPSQSWRVRKLTRGHDNQQRYELSSGAGLGQLAVRDGELVLQPRQGRPDAAAQWISSTTGDGTFTFVNAATGHVLDVTGQATHDGAPVSVWPPSSGANQLWAVTPSRA